MEKMRNLFAIILFFMCALNAHSQNLTIDELASLRKNGFANAEEFLSGKNWTFLEGRKPTPEKLGSAVFAFNKGDFNDKSKSFLDFLYNNTESEAICEHRIVLQFFDRSKYNSYINRFKTLGCKLIKSEIEDGNIIKIYQGATTTFKTTILTEKNEMGATYTIYKLFILSNVDYSLHFE